MKLVGIRLQRLDFKWFSMPVTSLITSGNSHLPLGKRQGVLSGKFLEKKGGRPNELLEKEKKKDYFFQLRMPFLWEENGRGFIMQIDSFSMDYGEDPCDRLSYWCLARKFQTDYVSERG